MSSALKILMGSGLGETADEDFELVTGLYHFNGSNAGNNNTILDSSGNSHSITRYGNVAQGTYTPFSAGTYDWSVFFDGSSHLEGSNFSYGANNFTVECFFYYTGNPSSASDHAALISETTNTNTGLWSLRVTGGNKLQFEVSGVVTLTGSTTISPGVWYHAAAVREGTSTNQTKLYLNGALEDTDTCATTFNAGGGVTIGMSNDGSSHPFEGYISGSKVNASASYTSAFTPNWTNSYGGGGGGYGWHCYSNRLRDGAFGNELATSGNPKVEPFSPFTRTTAYSASAHSGSAWFDEAGDSIHANHADLALGTGDFSVQCWVYFTATPVAMGLFQLSNADLNSQVRGPAAGVDGTTGRWGMYHGTSYAVHASEQPKAYSWYHVAFIRSSGTSKLYVDGVEKLSASDSTNYTDTNWSIGGWYSSSYLLNGYISDFRIVKDNVSTSRPSAPLTAITDTELLLNFTNASIIDSSAKNNVETQDLAQLSTSVKKFGTASGKFDGAGSDWLRTANPQISPRNLESWTIEFFVYLNAHKNYNFIYSAAANIQIGVGSDEKLGCWIIGGNAYIVNNLPSTSTLDTETWYHVALVRSVSAGTVTWFINGTASGQATSVTSPIDWNTNVSHVIGAYGGSTLWLNGYLDEFRITKKARYTSNFVAPTKEFFDIDKD